MAGRSARQFGSSKTAADISPQDALRAQLKPKPPREAEQALSEYVANKYRPERRTRDIEAIDCADVLSIYLADMRASGNEFDDLNGRIGRLTSFGLARCLPT
ncbi:MAG TPA: hypothetical protein VKB96_15655 [Gammaproteobacteria bacterium]|nr:hypothetical protein [Gammaproteobacteria bacterium]